jgi:hypothetical protein
MNVRNCRIHLLLVFTIVFFLLLLLAAGTAWSGERTNQWELGLGGGFNVDGLGAGHLLIAPGFSGGFPGHRHLRYRIEGDLELIKEDGEIIVVGGFSPFIRLIRPTGTVRPYFEVGGGPNLISMTRVGRKDVGGGFIISLMAGAGIELKSKIPLSISLRFRHLSNADLYSSNESINSLYLMLSAAL